MPVYIAEYRVAHKDKSVRMMVQAQEKKVFSIYMCMNISVIMTVGTSHLPSIKNYSK